MEQELKKYQAADEAAAQLSQKIDEKTAQKKELTGIRAEYGRALQVASEDSRKQALRENYEQLCAVAKEKESIYNAASAVFGEKAPDEAELLEKTKQAGELESLSCGR